VALGLALALGRADVDGLLEELTHEQFCEWADYLSLNPTGWQAMRIGIARLSFITAQAHSRKKLRERDFDITIGKDIHTPEADAARLEAYSIRSNIRRQRKRIA